MQLKGAWERERWRRKAARIRCTERKKEKGGGVDRKEEREEE
jgi:hypothetical protein